MERKWRGGEGVRRENWGEWGYFGGFRGVEKVGGFRILKFGEGEVI